MSDATERPFSASGTVLELVPNQRFQGPACAHGFDVRIQDEWPRSLHNNPPPRVWAYTVPRGLSIGGEDDRFIVCADCFLSDLQRVLGAS